MADFKTAMEPILKMEAGYTIDTGGETWKGVARKFWSAWAGWKLIDEAKRSPSWSNAETPQAYRANSIILSKIKGLDQHVMDFYKKEFYDKLGGVSLESQSICGVILDSAINEGIFPAIKRAESILGMEQTGKLSPLLIIKLNEL